jgi:hypothetical protein
MQDLFVEELEEASALRARAEAIRQQREPPLGWSFEGPQCTGLLPPAPR